MKVWVNSCHAALEYDHAKCFAEAGHDVSGIFDVGSNQRPKVHGVTDVSVPEDVKQASTDRKITLAQMGNPDVVVVHQTHDFVKRSLYFASLGVPTVLVVFGQGDMPRYERLAHIGRMLPNFIIVVYSLKEFIMLTRAGMPSDRLHMIRFAKAPDEYEPHAWVGSDKRCFVPCNSIHNRGGGCNWSRIEWLLNAQAPLLLGGRDTQEVGGLGELSYDDYRLRLRTAALYLHVGTVPAPYTLTLIEAAHSGTPIIAFDNGCGLAIEAFHGVRIVKDDEDAMRTIKAVLSDPFAGNEMHKASCDLAATAFSWDSHLRQWSDVFDYVTRYL